MTSVDWNSQQDRMRGSYNGKNRVCRFFGLRISLDEFVWMIYCNYDGMQWARSDARSCDSCLMTVV